MHLYSYYRLDKKKACTLHKLKIKEDNKGKFYITSKFSFFFDNKQFSGRTNFSRKFLNYQAALEEAKKMAKINWDIWFDSKNPAISSLEKQFPLKNIIYTFIISGIIIYFFILRYKLKTYEIIRTKNK
jgi:hypothetical protein